ncbi:MAG: NIPSNAP family protein [Candidatus Thorarchaeota archaeon]
MSLYMLYHSKTKPEYVGKVDELRMKFERLYEKYKIDILGFWTVEDDDSEAYYISKYDSEDDYKTKVDLLRKDSEYQRLGEELKETRLSTEATRLVPMGSSK